MEFYKLNNETIDLLSYKLGEMYKTAGSSKKELMRAKLLLEEALLKYQSHFRDDMKIAFRSYRIFGQQSVGKAYIPLYHCYHCIVC